MMCFKSYKTDALFELALQISCSLVENLSQDLEHARGYAQQKIYLL